MGRAKKFKFIISQLYLNWIHVFETIVKQLSRLISKCPMAVFFDQTMSTRESMSLTFPNLYENQFRPTTKNFN